MLSWDVPAQSPGCSLPSLRFLCYLCAKIMKSWRVTEPVLVLSAKLVIIRRPNVGVFEHFEKGGLPLKKVPIEDIIGRI